jgi:hypothetical protein
MPYVALAPVTREAGTAAASARWDDVLASRPELEPAVALQQQLLGIVAKTAEVLQRGRLPKLSLPGRYLAAKLDRGVPALSGEPIPVPVPVLTPAALALCEALSKGGAGEAADHIRLQITETRIDAGSLLAASLKRDQAAIRTGAEHRGLSPDLLWLVAELAVSPFAYALQDALFGSIADDSPLRAALDGWAHGYCALCGSWPAIAEVANAHRVLRCRSARRLGAQVLCVHLLRESGEKFVTAAQPGAHGSTRRDLQDVRFVRRRSTCRRSRRFVPRHFRSRDDGRTWRDGERLLAAAAQGVQPPIVAMLARLLLDVLCRLLPCASW